MTAKQAHALTDSAHPIAKASPEFDAAFLEHWQAIHRTLTRLVGDPAEAEDLALETFWRLYQNLPGAGRDFNIGGWLYRVATNLGLNALRARKRRERREMDGYDRESADTSDPAQTLVAEEERMRVRQALGAMPPQQAQLLFLRHSGMSYAELASALDLTPSSVGTLLARAEREFESRYRQMGE